MARQSRAFKTQAALSVRTKILLGALVPLPVLVASVWLAYRAIEHGASVGEQLASIDRDTARAQTLLKRVVDAETGVRGFVITANETFLEPYVSGVAGFSAGAMELKNTFELERRALSPQLQEWMDVFERWRTQAAEPVILARRTAPLALAEGANEAKTLAARLRVAEANPEAQARLLSELRRVLEGAQHAHRNLPRADLLATALTAVVELEAALPRPAAEIEVKQSTAQTAVRDWTEGVLTAEALALSGTQAATGKALVDQMRRLEGALIKQLAEQRAVLAAGQLTGLRSGRAQLLLAMTFALLLSVVASFTVAGGVFRSAQELASAARSWAIGDLSRRAAVTSRDELGVVSAAFNVMAEQVQRRDQEAEQLRRMGELLQAAHTTQEGYEVVGRFAGALFPRHPGGLYVAHEAKHSMVLSTKWGEAADLAERDAFELEDCWALRGGRVHPFTPGGGVPCKHLSANTAEGSLCLPITAQGESLGVLHLRSGPLEAPRAFQQPDDPFDAESLRLAGAVADQVGLALVNLRLRERLRDQEIRDPLTGLFNRRYLEETLPRELDRARRSEGHVSALILDVDHFKRLNDTHGQVAGDALLSELGALLRQQFRGSDICCRYGGEEFVVVMPDAGLSVALKRAEELRQLARKSRVVHQGKSLGTVTVSVGVAEYPRHGSTGDSVLKAADVALYEAKHRGRDQVRSPDGRHGGPGALIELPVEGGPSSGVV